jgi:hypothetical protein
MLLGCHQGIDLADYFSTEPAAVLPRCSDRRSSFTNYLRFSTRRYNMPDTRYVVVPNRDQWLIKYNNQDYGPYRTESEATLFAVDAAKKLAERGHRTSVYVMGVNGRLRRAWAADLAA